MSVLVLLFFQDIVAIHLRAPKQFSNVFCWFRVDRHPCQRADAVRYHREMIFLGRRSVLLPNLVDLGHLLLNVLQRVHVHL